MDCRDHPNMGMQPAVSYRKFVFADLDCFSKIAWQPHRWFNCRTQFEISKARSTQSVGLWQDHKIATSRVASSNNSLAYIALRVQAALQVNVCSVSWNEALSLSSKTKTNACRERLRCGLDFVTRVHARSCKKAQSCNVLVQHWNAMPPLNSGLASFVLSVALVSRVSSRSVALLSQDCRLRERLKSVTWQSSWRFERGKLFR